LALASWFHYSVESSGLQENSPLAITRERERERERERDKIKIYAKRYYFILII
jgi:hypothetical protein